MNKYNNNIFKIWFFILFKLKLTIVYYKMSLEEKYKKEELQTHIYNTPDNFDIKDAEMDPKESRYKN